MKILLELHYLPCVQYLSKFPAGEVVIEQHEHYQKGSYRNRCHLAGPNGLIRLSVPLRKGKNEQLPIREVRISYDETWPRQHIHTLRAAYGSAPYFDYYAPPLFDILNRRPAFLFDLNLALLQQLLEYLKTDRTFSFSTSYELTPPQTIDFRNGIHPKKHRQKEDPEFRTNPYPQVFTEKHGFLPNLSVLDLLFCAGPQAILLLNQES